MRSFENWGMNFNVSGGARMKIGVGLQSTNRDLERLLWLNFDSILIMPESINDARWLRAQGWQGEIWLRWYASDIMAMPAYMRSKEVSDWLNANNDVNIQHIIPGNELNLSLEHPSTGDLAWDTEEMYQAINQWLLDFWGWFHELQPTGYILHWPALAPGHNPEGYGPDDEYRIMEQSLKLYDEIDVHVYGPVDDVWTGTGRLSHILEVIRGIVPDKVTNVTEINSVNYIDYLQCAKGLGISDNFWFLWDAEDPAHKAFDLKDAPYLPELKQYIQDNREGGQPMPDEQDLKGRYLATFEAWWQAGGYKHFERHLQAINVLPIEDKEAYIAGIKEDAQALVEQARKASPNI